MVNKIESLLMAIGRLNGAFNPDTECYSINNPLMTRSFARPGRHIITDAGIRVFDSILAGIKAGLYDLELKVQGKSRAGLKPTNTLTDLLGCYGIKQKAAIDNIIAFLRRALKDQTISATTQLTYFIPSPPPSTDEKSNTELLSGE